MASLIWTEPALLDLDEIAEYIALDNPLAASRYVQRVFDRVEKLEKFPKAGKRPKELQGSVYRKIVVSPCRIFYRIENEKVFILYVMRAEQLLRTFLLKQRDKI
jgi:toxin ParE1/3/4